MNNKDDLGESVIFPRGQKITNDHFIGSAWLETLVPGGATFNCSVANVTFEPGARNNWHRHPGSQILLVTGGEGYSQEEGQPVRVIRKGDVVEVAPGVKHWHGAAPDSWLVHIAVIPNLQKGDAEWLEPVMGEEYRNLKPALKLKRN
jgi:quercetin dioxygenase-like cupin family protein